MNIWTVLKNFFLEITRQACKTFSSFKDECISEKYHLSAIEIFKLFKMNTLNDYLDLYLRTDVLSLSDALKKFISICLEYHGLHPRHYFRSPGLS